ncbi:MAG TPA: thioesterase family protein [Acidimicrobiales bacterium]
MSNDDTTTETTRAPASGPAGGAMSRAVDAAVHEFDRATAVVLRRADDEGTAVHDVDVDAGWSIGDKPNGGYLLATIARAAVEATAAVEGPHHPHALSAAAAYVRPPSPGPAEVHSEVMRRGRGMSQVRARLVQDGEARVDATFTVGRLRADAEPWWGGEPVPATAEAPPEGRTPTVGPGGVHLPIMERVDIRLDPATAGFALGQPAGVGEIRARLRFADGRAPDPLALLYAVDALPPATFDLAGTTGWVPTLSLSVYVRAVPAPGPLVVRQRAGLVEARTVDEVCDVWDSRGRLVAQATQLAGIRTS